MEQVETVVLQVLVEKLVHQVLQVQMEPLEPVVKKVHLVLLVVQVFH